MLTTVERQIIIPNLGTVVEKIVFKMVKDIKVVFGKGPDSRSVQSDDRRAPMWKRRIFFGSYLIGKS